MQGQQRRALPQPRQAVLCNGSKPATVSSTTTPPLCPCCIIHGSGYADELLLVVILDDLEAVLMPPVITVAPLVAPVVTL